VTDKGTGNLERSYRCCWDQIRIWEVWSCRDMVLHNREHQESPENVPNESRSTEKEP